MNHIYYKNKSCQLFSVSILITKIYDVKTTESFQLQRTSCKKKQIISIAAIVIAKMLLAKTTESFQLQRVYCKNKWSFQLQK